MGMYKCVCVCVCNMYVKAHRAMIIMWIGKCHISIIIISEKCKREGKMKEMCKKGGGKSS